MPTVFETLLRPFAAKKPAATVAQQRAAAQEVAAKLQTAREELAAAHEAHGPLLLKALAAGDNLEAAKLRDGLGAKESAVSDLAALHRAAQEVVRQLGEREAAAALGARWAAAQAQGNKVTALAAELQTWARVGAPLVLKLLEAQEELTRMTPRPPGQLPTGWGAAEVEYLLTRELAAHAAPMFAKARGLHSVDELLKGPGFADRIGAAVGLMLRHAPAESKPTTTAAKAAS